MTTPISSQSFPLLPVQDPASSLPPVLWGEAVAVPANNPRPWLWHGYLAPGKVTLLTSQWKSGKTTLVSILLSRLQSGGQLAGLPLSRGRAVVVSEESCDAWDDRRRRLGIGNNVGFLCRPFRSKPTPEEWLGLVEHLVALHVQEPIDLVVVDTLTSFLPGRNESNSGVVLAALMPLHDLSTRGVSILLVHHPYKGVTLPGQATRGSGALPSFVDIIIEMYWCGNPGDADRRRRLQAFSRQRETPRQLVIELNAESNDYTALGDFQADEFAAGWPLLRMVLEDAPRKLTRRDIFTEWPPDFARPNFGTLWRWLDHALAQGLLLRDGTGRRHDPFRYWLPDQEARWRQDPLHRPDPYDLVRQMKAQLRSPSPAPPIRPS